MEELKLYSQDLYDLLTSFFTKKNDCRLRIQCLGNSMAPFIRHKNIVTLKSIPDEPGISKGDIVAVKDQKKN